jgi:protein-S-isoprenylcysteine O-methyltransferase Ste14
MAGLALVVLVVWLLVVAGLRTYIGHRQTGTIAVLARAQPGSPAWWAKMVSSVGVVLAFAAPIAELIGLAPIGAFDHSLVRYAGLGVAIAGIVGAFASQLAMGESWRGDVDPEARTRLVTDGPFRLVRNPILTCTAATGIGLALMVPTSWRSPCSRHSWPASRCRFGSSRSRTSRGCTAMPTADKPHGPAASCLGSAASGSDA